MFSLCVLLTSDYPLIENIKRGRSGMRPFTYWGNVRDRMYEVARSKVPGLLSGGAGVKSNEAKVSYLSLSRVPRRMPLRNAQAESDATWRIFVHLQHRFLSKYETHRIL